MKVSALIVLFLLAVFTLTQLCFGAENPVSFKFGMHVNSDGQETPITWFVKNRELAGPGPNRFDNQCVTINKDKAGVVTSVEFKITKINKTWCCAEIYTAERFGLGTYTFRVNGSLNKFDKNIVLGMFCYPTEDVGQDGTHEIGIEVSNFGGANEKALCYGMYPTRLENSRIERLFDAPKLATTIHHFTRNMDTISFSTTSIPTRTALPMKLSDWLYTAVPNDPYVQDKKMPVHMNLWLFQGNAPTNGKEVKVTLTDFSFKEPRSRNSRR